VLTVDDAPEALALLGRVLTRAGYAVESADDGVRAVEMAIERRPDLVLLDMQMPRQDGLETCRLLKARPETESIPVIFVTAGDDAESFARAYAAGAGDFLTKPYVPEQVLARVSLHIRLLRAGQQIVQRDAVVAELRRKLAVAAGAAADDLTRAGR
jgi:DNA-binding response OmpR family regulator